MIPIIMDMVIIDMMMFVFAIGSHLEVIASVVVAVKEVEDQLE